MINNVIIQYYTKYLTLASCVFMMVLKVAIIWQVLLTIWLHQMYHIYYIKLFEVEICLWLQQNVSKHPLLRFKRFNFSLLCSKDLTLASCVFMMVLKVAIIWQMLLTIWLHQMYHITI